jgi:4-hydroxymandelate synthase
MRIQAIDHVEYYAADIDEAASQLCDAFGFTIHGSRVASPAARSVLLRNGDIQLLLTTGLDPAHPAARYVAGHGDGVGVIAFRTDDVQAAYGQILAAGGTSLAPPGLMPAPGSRVTTAMVGGFGDVTHRLVERSGPADEFAPGVIDMVTAGPDEGLLKVIDHVAVCLPAGQLDDSVAFYRDVFGLSQIFDERIEVGGQAMLSKVVQDHSGTVTFTLIEPDLTRDPGQIDDFLNAHGGAGVQHLAFRTPDIAAAVRTFSGRGVEFLATPARYFASLPDRLGDLAIPVGQLQELNILADRDRWGQMFQIFSLSTHERNTFFIELIERQGALTFGTRNIQALYEALDRQNTSTTQLT